MVLTFILFLVKNNKMAPNLFGTSALFLSEATTKEIAHTLPSTSQHYTPIKRIAKSKENKSPWQIVWRNVIAFVYLHVAGLYGLYLFIRVCHWGTFTFMLLCVLTISQGITSGAHRLWAHRAYKAKLPLRIILMILQTMALQNHIYEWVRDHRVHHKFTDTDADPHNAKRGFFFSHMGWLMLKKHKDVMIKGKTVDMSDLEADPVVRFQRKFYLLMVPIFSFIIPTIIPIYFFGEDPWTSFYVAGIFRYTLSLNFTWLVNSAAHIWGNKPYDKTIGPTQNVYVSIVAVGEGWHNYHHIFPWDYKAAELGDYKLNFSTMIIDFFAKIGWAYDLKTVSLEMIEKRAKRTGDGTRKVAEEYNLDDCNDHQHHHHEGIWGWGDVDMNEEEIRDAKILNTLKEK